MQRAFASIMLAFLSLLLISGAAGAQPSAGFCSNTATCFASFPAATCAAIEDNCPGIAGVSGSGTPNFLPKFTAPSSIGDSSISDDGSVVTLFGSRIFFGGADSTPELEAGSNMDLKAINGVRLSDSSNSAKFIFNFANTTAGLTVLREWAGSPRGVEIRPDAEHVFAPGFIGRGFFTILQGNAGHQPGSFVIGYDAELATSSAATEIAFRASAGWDADILTKDHNLAVQAAPLANPPAGEVKLYARDDINQGIGGAAVDCALVARTSIGVETLVSVIVIDGFCP